MGAARTYTLLVIMMARLRRVNQRYSLPSSTETATVIRFRPDIEVVCTDIQARLTFRAFWHTFHTNLAMHLTPVLSDFRAAGWWRTLCEL
jgi:hypothetical protein